MVECFQYTYCTCVGNPSLAWSFFLLEEVMSTFEKELEQLNVHHDHVEVKFLGFQGEKKDVAKVVLKIIDKDQSNLILITLPSPEDNESFFVESSMPTFDSEVNGNGSPNETANKHLQKNTYKNWTHRK
ncbi:hypothetical protein RFI_13701 [Reticulomyxa filosa]|uniref:Uncharacterized protein n=1 Tax=Reticulomyxa filosa TaxID=46433 RepID=X6NB22_RETFI|nr:hypothetical protein RFI_13701 [Reticulomyxa filosa]|eukprot:ETO23480.1 hypothetical protein RFI_13701 [Reticulomyxa filosa]